MANAKTKVRINVTLEPPIWRKGKRLAKVSKRSFSNQVETLIDEAWSRTYAQDKEVNAA